MRPDSSVPFFKLVDCGCSCSQLHLLILAASRAEKSSTWGFGLSVVQLLIVAILLLGHGMKTARTENLL